MDLILSRYLGFGPTLAHEKLVGIHGMNISDDSVRQIMITEGVWKPNKARKLVVHQMRERRVD